jgi:hypothetical protein
MLSTPSIRVQGRTVSAQDFTELQERIDAHPHWSRHAVAKEVCERWAWQTALGEPKTFAARSLLLKLEQSHGLRLPAVRAALRRSPWGLPAGNARSEPAAQPPPPLEMPLAGLQPLVWHLAGYGSPERERALAHLKRHHYLGCNRAVGTHLVYLVMDRQGRDLAVHLVGAAAWQCAARESYIGWNAAARARALPRIANHSRFLILPWVRVPHLATHLLGGLTRRISADWLKHHGWRLELLESFVETGRFTGLAYRAANWKQVGQTTGRTRQEKHHRQLEAPKSVWLYALHRRFREHLSAFDANPRQGAQ